MPGFGRFNSMALSSLYSKLHRHYIYIDIFIYLYIYILQYFCEGAMNFLQKHLYDTTTQAARFVNLV